MTIVGLGSNGFIKESLMSPAFYFSLGIYLLIIWSVFLRNSFGRFIGILVCIPLLNAVPVGTVVALLGLWTFFKNKDLFGKERITHKDLKKELSRRGK